MEEGDHENGAINIQIEIVDGQENDKLKRVVMKASSDGSSSIKTSTPATR